MIKLLFLGTAICMVIGYAERTYRWLRHRRVSTLKQGGTR